MFWSPRAARPPQGCPGHGAGAFPSAGRRGCSGTVRRRGPERRGAAAFIRGFFPTFWVFFPLFYFNLSLEERAEQSHPMHFPHSPRKEPRNPPEKSPVLLRLSPGIAPRERWGANAEINVFSAAAKFPAARINCHLPARERASLPGPSPPRGHPGEGHPSWKGRFIVPNQQIVQVITSPLARHGRGEERPWPRLTV